MLQDNGFKLPWIGKNLSIHPAIGMFARSPKIQSPWRAIPQSYGVEGLVDERVRFEGFYAPPQLSAPMLGMVGQKLTHWMDAQPNLSQYGFMVRDHNVGTVHRGPGGRPLIRYDVTADVHSLLQNGASTLAELLLRGGAEEVWAGVGPVDSITTIDEAKAIASLSLRPSDFRTMAFHPLGTCRMGSNSEQSVVDFEHRVHGMENLYVVDGSTVPTSLGVNPQITIMAMAERAATLLSDRLQRRN
jgi:choline dehydrogenase-like flavoprotein